MIWKCVQEECSIEIVSPKREIVSLTSCYINLSKEESYNNSQKPRSLISLITVSFNIISIDFLDINLNLKIEFYQPLGRLNNLGI